MIPLSKGLCTDLGNELTSLAVQIHGGMGFVEETGVAQHYRDIRIAAIYEGTNGIQAADLVGRKLAMRGGGVVTDLLDELQGHVDELAGDPSMTPAAAGNLGAALAAARRGGEHLLGIAATDQRSLLAGSAPYLRLLGTAVCGGLLAKAAVAARDLDPDTALRKQVVARFFGEQIAPTTAGLLPSVEASAADLDALTAAQMA